MRAIYLFTGHKCTATTTAFKWKSELLKWSASSTNSTESGTSCPHIQIDNTYTFTHTHSQLRSILKIRITGIICKTWDPSTVFFFQQNTYQIQMWHFWKWWRFTEIIFTKPWSFCKSIGHWLTWRLRSCILDKIINKITKRSEETQEGLGAILGLHLGCDHSIPYTAFNSVSFLW